MSNILALWPRAGSIAAGLWLMAAPALLDYGDPARASDRIVGPCIAAIAVIAISEITRSLRWVNVALGLWLVVASVALRPPADAAVSTLIAGAVVVFCAMQQGPRTQRYGGGWPSLWRSNPPDHQTPNTKHQPTKL